MCSWNSSVDGSYTNCGVESTIRHLRDSRIARLSTTSGESSQTDGGDEHTADHDDRGQHHPDLCAETAIDQFEEIALEAIAPFVEPRGPRVSGFGCGRAAARRPRVGFTH